MRQFKVIVEKHPDGYVAYPIGLKGVVVSQGDTYEEALADVVTLGGKWVTIPSLPGSVPLTAEGYRRVAEEFNQAGEIAKQYGLKLLFHNHGVDFSRDPETGTVIYDVLVEETNPGLVGFVLDTYWAVHAGADPAHYFQSYPGRFPVLHVKDMEFLPQGPFADVGSGVLDFEGMFKFAHKAGVRQWHVEHDGLPGYTPALELQTARNSYPALRDMRF
jgi:sugar phosphate isomerase/epimerase